MAFHNQLLNALNTALRYLKRNPNLLFIQVAGLTVGLSSVLLIFIYVNNQVNFDRFHSKADRIYRVPMTWSSGDIETKTSLSVSAAGPFLMDNYATIENYVRFRQRDISIKMEDEIIDETGFVFADSTLFQIFDFKLIKGNSSKALVERGSIVLSESMAEKYFGSDWASKEIIGHPIEIIEVIRARSYIITGIMQDLPQNSHIQFDFIGSYTSLGDSRGVSWGASLNITYVLATKGTQPEKIKSLTPIRVNEKSLQGYDATIHLETLNDIYLRSGFGNALGPVGNQVIVNIFSGVSILILLIVIINYINFSTAKSIKRFKEIGIRKIVGAYRANLVFQFLFEAFIIVALSGFLSFVVASAFLTKFNSLTGLNIDLGVIFSNDILLKSGAFILIISALAGIYPAYYFSKIKPRNVLKGKYGNKKKETAIRKSLLTFQIVITIVLLFGALVIQRQMDYLQSKELGYSDDNVISIPIYRLFNPDLANTLKSEILTLPGVHEVSITQEPIHEVRFATKFFLPGDPDGDGLHFIVNQVDENFIPLFDLDLKVGSNFNKLAETDTGYYFILNQSALHQFGWDAKDVIGRKLIMNWGVKGNKLGTVKGVIKDFHFRSLYEPIEPLILIHTNNQIKAFLMAKIDALDQPFILENIKGKWNQLVNYLPFDYVYLNQRISSKYKSEKTLAYLITAFTLVGLLIACMGLVSLASYLVIQKVREVGIRKVFGAGVINIVKLFSYSFTKIVLIGATIGLPIAIYISQWWLNDFAYRINITLSIISISFITVFLVSLFTVSYHTFKASMAKPVDSLRHNN